MCVRYVVTMFLQRNTKHVGPKTYHSALIVESFRENKKVKHRIIANISKLPIQIIDSIGEALKGRSVDNKNFEYHSGKNFGALWATQKIAESLSITKTLGCSTQAMLVMIMISGRILTQGSRRHLKFWKDGQAIEDIFGISDFDEDDLYKAMDWLESRQEKLEKKLFDLRYKDKKVRLFLYDITSSYLEGQHNELAEYGYNRDGKKGRKQIVYGLLTDDEGSPISVEVFKGNTSDSTTVPEQVRKLAERFGVKEVVFIGDRGMVKKAGIESIHDKNWRYITAITKSQIESLITKDILQLGLFEEKLVEVEDKGIRYILRRNPVRAEEIQRNRDERICKVECYCRELNEKLAKRPKTKEDVALRSLVAKINQLKLFKIFSVEIKDRKLTLVRDEGMLKEISDLDGCYVIKTDVEKEELSTEKVHSVYKNLSFVEWAFRTMKTGFLEIRPLYHRKANRTRACVLIAMFAYMILHHIFKKCQDLNLPLQPLMEKLDQIQTGQIEISGQLLTVLPKKLRDDQQKILDALGISLPVSLDRKSVV